MMSFVGSIGALMDAFGLNEILQTIYWQNTVKHIITGKAIARAIRGHILVESALYLKLQKMVLEGNSSEEILPMTDAEIVDLKAALGSSSDISELPAIQKFLDRIDLMKVDLGRKSRTAKLWLQYMDYVEIMRQYIRAARTGDWNLHLFTLQKMLNQDI